MNLTRDERVILDLASEDYYGLFEVAANRKGAEAGIRGLLSKGLIALFRKIGPNTYQPVSVNDYEEALADANWNSEIEGNYFIAFTTTEEGDRVYESGELM
jgi:hypothetical protein